MREIARSLIFGLLGGALWCPPARSDGGALLLSETRGGDRISVFTTPTPVRAGSVDVSVLVQDDSTGAPNLRREVRIRLSQRGQSALETLATSAAATNKLFQAARLDIPDPGRWELQLSVSGGPSNTRIDAALDVAEPLPRWQQMWPWICWPALVIVLFAVHQALTSAARRSSPRQSIHS
jgi:hypothetical protein